MYRRVLLPIFYKIVYGISTCIRNRVSGIGYEHNCKILDIEDYHKKIRLKTIYCVNYHDKVVLRIS